MKHLVTRPQVSKEPRMDVHQNAKRTFAFRVLLVERIAAGRPKIQVARNLGVSSKTANKWLRRYRDEGRDGLKDRRCRPHRSPAATVEVLKAAVIARRRQRMALITIPTQLHLSRSTMARIAKAAGLNRLTKLEPAPVYRRFGRLLPRSRKKRPGVVQGVCPETSRRSARAGRPLRR